MMRIIILLFALLATFSNGSSAYRILGVFPLNGRSHDMMFESLMLGLAKHGHRVDVVTHFPPKDPPKNYRTILDLSSRMENLVNNLTVDFVLGFADDIVMPVATLYGNRLCDLMAMKEFQEIIHNPPINPPYDIFVTEAFGANCYMGIGHHMGIPIIAVSSAVEYPWVSDFTGNNDNPAVVPNGLFSVFGDMDFWERLQNTVMYHNIVKHFQSLTEQAQTESMRKYISPDMPSIRSVEKSVALTIVNSHPLLFGMKPVLPTLVQVAGLHIEERETRLQTDLRKWMDESTQGVVYFTFGSMVLIESLPTETLQILYSSFAKIAPVRVLMKIADKNKLPPGLSSNVLTSSWLPQQSILAHKNTKVFMTHGGLMGSEEALYFGVPMIGIPLFADQFRNVKAFVAKNMSIELPLEKLTEQKLDAALNSTLLDPTYRNNAKRLSRLFRDRPMSATETAVYWVEYIARNGADVLRPPALKLAWWQLALLDVYAFIVALFILAGLTTYLVFKLVLVKIIIYFVSSSHSDSKKFE